MALSVKMRRNTMIYILVSTGILAVLCFFVDPLEIYREHGYYIDLNRFYRDMFVFQTYGWEAPVYFLRTPYETIPIVKIIVFIVSKTGVYGLLPALACIVVYYSFGYVLIKIKKESDVSDWTTVLAFFFFIVMNNYVNTFSNIRMPMGISVFVVILYKDLIEHKSFVKCMMGYCALIFLHPIFVVFIMFRILAFFTNKYSLITTCLVSVGAGVVLGISDAVSGLTSGNVFLTAIFEKINYYTRDEVANHVDSAWVAIACVRIIILSLSLWCMHQKCKKEKIKKYEEMEKFAYIVLCFTIGANWNFHLFTRMSNLIVYLFIIFFVINRSCKKELSALRNKTKTTLYSLICWSVVILHFVYFHFSHQYNMVWFN